MKKVILALFLLLATISNAQTIQKYFWTAFEGTIGKNEIVVNIYCDSTGNLTGDYCYKKYETRIPLKGKINNNALYLDELIDNKINARFNGKINESDNTVSGKWSSTQNSDMAFSLRLASKTGGTPENRYGFGDNEKTETFFKKIKTSILKDDKAWLSKNIKYPISVNIASKRVKVKTAKDFVAKYSKIMNAKYKSDIQNNCICDIFSNWRGAMFANGLVWINQLDNEGLKITAINN